MAEPNSEAGLPLYPPSPLLGAKPGADRQRRCCQNSLERSKNRAKEDWAG